MFGKLNKITADYIEPKLKYFKISWYPSGRNFNRLRINGYNSSELPPLMVRKPAWRR